MKNRENIKILYPYIWSARKAARMKALTEQMTSGTSCHIWSHAVVLLNGTINMTKHHFWPASFEYYMVCWKPTFPITNVRIANCVSSFVCKIGHWFARDIYESWNSAAQRDSALNVTGTSSTESDINSNYKFQWWRDKIKRELKATEMSKHYVGSDYQ